MPRDINDIAISGPDKFGSKGRINTAYRYCHENNIDTNWRTEA